MGWRILRAAGLAFLLCGFGAHAAEPARLAPRQALVARGSLSAAQAASPSFGAAFEAARGDAPVAFSPDNELWVALHVTNPWPRPQFWTLQVRQTSLDEVAFFDGAHPRAPPALAGDRVPQSQWARPGRFPRFEVVLQPNESRSVYLRIRNTVAAPVPLQLVDEAQGEKGTARADFGLAFTLGGLALLALASFIQAALYRDGSYFIFGAYALLLGFALASISGMADQLLWGDNPAWADVSKTVFPLGAAGVSIFLVAALCKVRQRSAPLARASAVLGALVVAAALACAVLQRAWAPLVAAAMFISAATVLFVAGWTWRRGDSIGKWVAAAHAPIIVTTALIVLRMAGIEPVPFRPNVLVSGSLAFILLLMLVALIRRSKELLAVRVRAQGMESIDSLTGMLSAPLFHDRVRAAVERFARSRHDAAVMHVRVANFDRIRQAHGLAVAEQSMIRAAMKLQRVMREADCFGRVGESTLGLIVETVTRREALLERASRLVAHGLMPLPGLKPEVTLVLHVAVDVLSENPLPAAALQAALDAQLDAMGERSRRPIRFLAPASTAPGLLEEPESAPAAVSG